VGVRDPGSDSTIRCFGPVDDDQMTAITAGVRAFLDLDTSGVG
jgi:hypothetical protein